MDISRCFVLDSRQPSCSTGWFPLPAKPQEKQREIFSRLENLMHSVSSLKRDRQDLSLSEVVNSWRQWLYEQDRSAGTIKKYLQAVAHFLEWYEQEERMP